MQRKLVVFVLIVVSACGGGGTGDDTTTLATATPVSTAPVASTSTSVDDGDGPAPELAGTSWTVTHYFSLETNSVTNLWPDTEITIRFDSDTVSGNGGCNDFTGTYAVSGPYISDPGLDEEEGQMIEISELSWTDKACEGDDVMTQEVEFHQVLPLAARWFFGQGFSDVEGLLIRSTDGLILEAIPAG